MSVRRHELSVKFHNLLHHSFKQIGGKLRHKYAATCALQTLRIGFDTENPDLAVFASVSLQSLKSFLSVVQASGCHVNVECCFRRNFYFTPFAIAIITTHIIISGDITEFEILPIDIFHFRVCISLIISPQSYVFSLYKTLFFRHPIPQEP